MRRAIKVGVAYGSSLRDVSQTLLAQAEKHNLVLKDPAPDVIFSDFGESVLQFTLRFWVQVGAAGIHIAYPQRDMNMTSSAPLKIRLLTENSANAEEIR